MARRLSQRQKERIQKIQERRRQRISNRVEGAIAATEAGPAQRGRVVASHGANLAVEAKTGRLYHCLSRQNLGHITCGDWVAWQPLDPHNGVVVALLPRTTVLSRPDYSGRDKPLAANITQLIVVIAPTPQPSEYLLDQYLVTAELIGVQVIIAINKSDLLDASTAVEFERRFGQYTRFGYPLIYVNTRSDACLMSMQKNLAAHSSILVGQSGVGKSSLVKALLPDRDIQTGKLSAATGLGRHTTSATTCYRLPNGGRLIDSPGVRSFRLGAVNFSQLEQGFREFRPFLGRCRFADCRHRQEPDCALKKAVTEGKINPERMENFSHLARQIKTNSES